MLHRKSPPVFCIACLSEGVLIPQNLPHFKTVKPLMSPLKTNNTELNFVSLIDYFLVLYYT